MRLSIDKYNQPGIKKRLRTNQQALNLWPSVLLAPLNQSYTASSSSRLLPIVTLIWYQRQAQSGPKGADIVQPDTLGCSVFRCGREKYTFPSGESTRCCLEQSETMQYRVATSKSITPKVDSFGFAGIS